jgi:serine/threonine-protein kinase
MPVFSTPGIAVFGPDTVLDNTYRIVQRIASGGMGEVYLAAHERLPGYFAVKALQAELALHPESLARFRREAEILAGVRHPNVVQVVDFNISQNGVPYLVLEFIDGPDLATDLRDGRMLAPIEVMSIVRQVASALAAAHAVGVIHRDLKPENIVLITVSGQAPVVKVIDFGISISGVGPRITTDSRVMGTPEYMSPEQALGRREEIDARSDQFALAAVAHTLLAGQPPFRGDTPLATLSAIVHGQPESLADQVSWPAADVEAVLRKGMARVRDDRFSSVLEFAEALEAALRQCGALELPATSSPSTLFSTSSSSLSSPSHSSSSSNSSPSNSSPYLALSLVPAPVTALVDDSFDDELLVPARYYSPRALAGVTLTLIVLVLLLGARMSAPVDTQRAMNAASSSARLEARRVAEGFGQWIDAARARLKI